VAIVGAGVVGVATGRGLAARGCSVDFVDISPTRRQELERDGLRAMSPEELANARPEVYQISVPSPTSCGHIDLSLVEAAAESIGRSLSGRDDWALVVVRSTVPPGTSDELVASALERSSGRARGEAFGVSMNPEFLRARCAEDDFAHPRCIVAGVDSPRTEAAVRRLYQSWSEVPLLVMTNQEAEAAKYAANAFNAAKISFFNELHTALSGRGIDTFAAFSAAAMGAEGLWNPTYGIRAGEPFAGACLPKDLAGFIAFVRESGGSTPLLDAVQEINVALGGENLASNRP
jgi:UDPglucose 6-dehydrogenase